MSKSLNIIRWAIVIMLFVATVLNYVQRQTLSILQPELEKIIGLTKEDFATASAAFLVSYTIMYVVSGRLMDRIGVRIGAAACVLWWSVAGMLTSLATGPISLAVYRFLLGIGEPGIFPAGIKACGEWFEKKLRAFPIGVFSSGGAIGAIVAVPLVALLAHNISWQATFILPGIVAILWVPLWVYVYRKPSAHPRLDAADKAALAAQNGTSGAAVRWRDILSQRKVWGLLLARMCSDSVWYFYLLWIPVYLQSDRGMDLKQLAFFGWVPYLFADLGAMLGGGASDTLMRRGVKPLRARFSALLLVACLVPFGAFIGFADNIIVAVGLICLVMFLCQMWSINTATLVADLSKPEEVGTVMGLMGAAGSLWGAGFIKIMNWVGDSMGYEYVFLIAATFHPIGFFLLYRFLKPLLQREKTSATA